MKRFVLAAAAAVAMASGALAQNATQIAQVQNGRSSCAKCNLFQAELTYLELSGRSFAGARLRQASLELSTADRTNFAGADLSYANLYGARATGANFTRANLSQAVLVGFYGHGANFAGANLTGANLSGAELGGAHGLTQAQLAKACGDSATQLPARLTIPAC